MTPCEKSHEGLFARVVSRSLEEAVQLVGQLLVTSELCPVLAEAEDPHEPGFQLAADLLHLGHVTVNRADDHRLLQLLPFQRTHTDEVLEPAGHGVLLHQLLQLQQLWGVLKTPGLNNHSPQFALCGQDHLGPAGLFHDLNEVGH
jgi:hypothetical protein